MPTAPAADPSADLRSLLDTGKLSPVSAVCEQVLGRTVDPRTVLRWSLTGRAGLRLPTVRGVRRVHLTTEGAFRAWLQATSGDEITAQSKVPPPASTLAPKDAVADAVLASFGLGRNQRGKRQAVTA